MKHILVVGGTRNVGYALTQELVKYDHHITLLNRGKDGLPLPPGVHRLHADRTDPQQLKRALMAKNFDVVVDFALYKGQEAETMVNLLTGHVGRYIFMSTGQVYLVREGAKRPFSEEDYEGRVMPAPKELTYAFEEWEYGYHKRMAEDVFIAAHVERGFPYNSLRLPMVNSERDPFKRLYNYYLRMKDGGPILIPETPNFPLRHVYGMDVVKALMLLIENDAAIGRAYNISQDETVSVDEFLGLLGKIMGIIPDIRRYSRSELEAAGFLPDCSPFTERWMSELTNERSKAELGMTYTPLEEYLQRLVTYYEHTEIKPPPTFKRRHAEVEFVERNPY
ncbi:NAD-dependent epimerase/dehydratase family protein [Phototrophicus methaneseepsis]|uniref:UDP-glucose 4-epimerase n=1 Tax=Phototrophicus methaneseepsis TaxID=2710758 RepID=A0A7S8EC63_9CHLR|nr:NAD-dependent epimerase/dehydratase family protein [Phototrophicus methaneseepsis]QPC84273.1 NAD-dependent epimerase/dehydratase family protein [Phototrophicus methaneseepsis]